MNTLFYIIVLVMLFAAIQLWRATRVTTAALHVTVLVLSVSLLSLLFGFYLLALMLLVLWVVGMLLLLRFEPMSNQQGSSKNTVNLVRDDQSTPHKQVSWRSALVMTTVLFGCMLWFVWQVDARLPVNQQSSASIAAAMWLSHAVLLVIAMFWLVCGLVVAQQMMLVSNHQSDDKL